MKKILELRIWKNSFDPLFSNTHIAIYLLGRWKLAEWVYNIDTKIIE